MNFRQAYRMIIYRWKLFAVVFLAILVVAYIGFSFVSRFSYSRAALAEELAEMEEEMTAWKSNTIFMFKDTESVEILLEKGSPLTLPGLAKMAELYSLSEKFTGKIPIDADEEDFPLISVTTLNDCIWINVAGANGDTVQMVNEELSRDFLEMIPGYIDGLNVYTLYQDTVSSLVDETKPIAGDVTSDNGARIAVLSKPKVLALSFITAALCALGAVFAWENLDRSIRSIYHLSKATDIEALPTLSPNCSESELLTLFAALPTNKPVLITDVSQNISSPQLSANIASLIARDDFTVAIADFCGGATSDNQYVSIIDMREKSAADCLSERFAGEISALGDKHGQVLMAVPPASESGVAIALSNIAAVALAVRWGKDTDEQVQVSAGFFEKENIVGAVITGYRPNVDYIWERT
ncbi:MAG: hypothetical protein FWH57_06370 [Oscillospiraceae bacterium]|nr:hypothetical protein [Oscillospiraceae bacterium]